MFCVMLSAPRLGAIMPLAGTCIYS